MSTTTSRTKSLNDRNTSRQTETASEISQDIIEAVIKYGREKPASAALICLGVGFVLGWKLKPW